MSSETNRLLEELEKRVIQLETKHSSNSTSNSKRSKGPKEDVWKTIRATTLVESPRLQSLLGVKKLLIASETFQHTGSFKFRAAFNLASRVQQNKILTASSGNFGQVSDNQDV